MNIMILCNLITGESQPEELCHVAGQCNRSSGNDELLYGVLGKTKSLSGASVSSACSTTIQVDEALART